MEIGMLWFDNDKKRDLLAKLKRATKYYQDKYGKAPNLCFVHPSMLDTNNLIHQPGVEVRTSSMIQPQHFWIGVNQTDNGGSAR
jgi:hypothetical protein